MFSRHIDIRQYFLRELVLTGFLELMSLRNHKMVVDALTKSLPRLSGTARSQLVMLLSPLAYYVAWEAIIC